MKTTTVANFRKQIKYYLDSVVNDYDTLIINRGSDNAVVVMSLDEYNSLNATKLELSSKLNEKRLDSAIAKLKSEDSFLKNLSDE